MTDLEARLERALKVDGLAPRDPMFRIEILMRRERVAMRRQLVAAGGVALGAAILTPFILWGIGALLGASELRLAVIGVCAAALTLAFVGPYVGTPSLLRSLSARLRSPFTGR